MHVALTSSVNLQHSPHQATLPKMRCKTTKHLLKPKQFSPTKKLIQNPSLSGGLIMRVRVLAVVGLALMAVLPSN